MVPIHYTPWPRRSFVAILTVLLVVGLSFAAAARGEFASVGVIAPGEAEALASDTGSGPAKKPAVKFEELLNEGAAAFDNATAQEYLREVLPLVEEAAGRKFKKPPKLRLAGREEVGAALARDILPQLKNLMPTSDVDDLTRIAARQAANIAPVLLGKFGFTDRVLYLLPRNVEPLMRLAKIDASYRSGLVKLIIAHELTHALQDEVVDLSQMLSGMKTQEELLAFNATIEGFSVFIQERVGERLGLGEEVIQFSRFFTAGAIKFDDPAFELLNRAMAAQFEQIYLGGRKFIAFHHQQGGLARVWEIVKTPPTRTAMIKHPETWSPIRAEQPDYAKVLTGLERWFGDEKWLVDNIEIGQMGLQSAYAGLAEDERERLLAQIEHAQALVARVLNTSFLGNVTLIVLRDPSVGRQYIAAVEAMADRNFAQLNSSEKLRVTDIHANDVGEITASVARRVEFTLIPKGEAKMHNVIYRIVRGPLLIEITTCNVDLSPTSVDALSALVWRRYLALRQKMPGARLNAE